MDDEGIRIEPQPQEPDGNHVGVGASSDAPPPARPRDKVIAAVTALAAAGRLKSWQTDTEVRELAEAWLKSEGCARLPSPTTWKRELARLRGLWRPEWTKPTAHGP